MARKRGNKTCYYHFPGFCEAFRAQLIRSGLSRGQIARRLGYDRKTVYRWLDGSIEPRLGELLALSLILKCSVYDLLGGVKNDG